MFWLCAIMNACTNPQPHDTVRFLFIADHSLSFFKRYTFPDPSLFKYLCIKVSEKGTIDFRYGIVGSNSDVPFDRYYLPYKEKVNKNPWLSQGNQAQGSQDQSWDDFEATVRGKLNAPASRYSDISSTIKHSIACFQERTAGVDNSKVRKVLLLCTDYKDSFSDIPALPPDIEVIAVSILPTATIEHILHTKVQRFENLQAAIDFISQSL